MEKRDLVEEVGGIAGKVGARAHPPSLFDAFSDIPDGVIADNAAMTDLTRFVTRAPAGSRRDSFRALLIVSNAIAVAEQRKTTVRVASGEPLTRGRARRRKASPKAVALLERFKDVPSVDPHLFREDLDRVLDPGL